MTEKDNAGVVAPPPLIFGAGLALGLVADQLLSVQGIGLAPGARTSLGIGLCLLAAAIIAAAFFRFRRARTAIEPWEPTTAIVSDGVFAWSRNPIYVAMAIAFLGICLAVDSWIAILFLVPVLALVHFGVVRREERYLERKFGEDYRAYRRRVRRWL